MSRSMVEVEYKVIAYTKAELRWFCRLLWELGIYLPFAPQILRNSISTIFMAHNPVIQSSTQHMELDYYFVHKFMANKRLHISHIPTDQQAANIFTKALPIDTFRLHRLQLNLWAYQPPWFCGGVKIFILYLRMTYTDKLSTCIEKDGFIWV